MERPKVRFESTENSPSSLRPTSSRLRIQSIESVKKPFKLVREVRTSNNLKITGKSVQKSISHKKSPTTKLRDGVDNSKNHFSDDKIKSNKENIEIDDQMKNVAFKKIVRNLSVKTSSENSNEMIKLTKILDSVSIETPKELKSTKVKNLNKKPIKIIEPKAVNHNFINYNKKSVSNQLKMPEKQLKITVPYKSSMTQVNTSGIKRKISNIPSKTMKISILPKLQSKSLVKINKPLVQNSKSHIKVTTARNKSFAHPNVYVGPGLLRTDVTRSLSAVSDCKTGTACNFSTSNKLHKPEYNSVISTIKKINKSKNEKIVTDFEHLPHPYREFVVRKMSSALDFPTDKSIFRDLVDLSIDESQLPELITRTRDPQPRQKDLEPKLEDFFKPTCSEEHCISVKIRPTTPEIDDNLSAFNISDRILNWKSSLDK